ncbi:hypothetical protein CFN78_19700 [Amycolatopsis antarctica]|uniref:DUF4097 domain-containing protein n=2 Tax=Amycolatopsis antarctica TaxID=1854586 RepID=A0A263CZ57_9PSEU|nr:hypothetical protein CFN78_19700 [Amycolatopsis antarctica]
MPGNGRRAVAGIAACAATALLLSGCKGFLKVETTDESAEDEATVSETIGDVRFDVPSGDVRVRVQDGAPVSVKRTMEYSGDLPGPSHRVEGQTLVLQGCGDVCEVNYEVTVPENLAISGDSASGNVELDGTAAIDVRSSSGNVTARKVDGPVRVESASGTVEVVLAAPNDVLVDAKSGAATLEVPGGPYRVKAEASSGSSDVTVPDDRGAEHELDVTVASGSLTVRAA